MWTQVSRYQNVSNLDFTVQRVMEVVVITGAVRRAKLQSNRHRQQTITRPFTGRMLFLLSNQQCQSTEGNWSWLVYMKNTSLALSWAHTSTNATDPAKLLLFNKHQIKHNAVSCCMTQPHIQTQCTPPKHRPVARI